jgi:hypothetical protein
VLSKKKAEEAQLRQYNKIAQTGRESNPLVRTTPHPPHRPSRTAAPRPAAGTVRRVR